MMIHQAFKVDVFIMYSIRFIIIIYNFPACYAARFLSLLSAFALSESVFFGPLIVCHANPSDSSSKSSSLFFLALLGHLLGSFGRTRLVNRYFLILFFDSSIVR